MWIWIGLLSENTMVLSKLLPVFAEVGNRISLILFFIITWFQKKILEDHIIKFVFDSADDLMKIGEDPIVLDNKREDKKVDPSKFSNWLKPQISDQKMHYID